MRHPVSLWQRVQDRPYSFDLFQLLRRVEGAYPHLPRLGEANHPKDEAIRFAQDVSLSFAPAAISHVQLLGADQPVKVVQRVLGYLGPNGPMPTHLTEYVRERSLHNGDPTLQAFLDMLLHRYGVLFYRAWASAQPTVMLDRKGGGQVSRWLHALQGSWLPHTHERSVLPDEARLYFTGRLSRQVRDADGLQAWIAAYFGVTVHIQQFQGHWMALDVQERLRLCRYGQQGLGQGAVLGRQVWDVQHKFRMVLGPLTQSQYRNFLPSAQGLAALKCMVRQYVGLEFAWDLQLVLRAEEVPAWSLGKAGAGQLGRLTWLNQGSRKRNADQLVMQAG